MSTASEQLALITYGFQIEDKLIACLDFWYNSLFVARLTKSLPLPTRLTRDYQPRFFKGDHWLRLTLYLACNRTCVRDDELSSEPQDPRGSSLNEMALLRISLLVSRL